MDGCIDFFILDVACWIFASACSFKDTGILKFGDTNELVLCALPCHDTHAFVRIVQLLEIGNNRWGFLGGVKASGAPPPRKVIVQQCIRDKGGCSGGHMQLYLSASFASKLSKGHSLLGSLANNTLGLLRTSRDEIAKLGCSNFFSQLQQQRTFIQMSTNLKVVDNSGAKRVMCIQALKGKSMGARLGDTIIASVKEAQPRGKVKKGEVVYGVVVRAAMQRGRCGGSEIKFDDNAVVLVNQQGEPIGTRVFGPVPHELRKKKHVKILTLAEHIA
ncbi:hypothetical protein MRB53_007695 [Persea americana]|uniref:Uncharacterized protein n=1 Tax=Persea americana TaxID=3435 RepID=A0ACC2MLA9_PERAE|nr:hypothetical protein MRB53_007695 [Persea americana]